MKGGRGMFSREDFEEAFGMRKPPIEDSPAEAGQQIEAYIAARRCENRCKMLLIPQSDILWLLNYHREDHQFLSLPAAGQMPADAVIEAVTHDIGYGGFLCRVWSSEFPIVPSGERPPMMGMIEFETVDLSPPVEIEQESLSLLDSQWDTPTTIASFQETIDKLLKPEIHEQLRHDYGPLVYSPSQIAAITAHWEEKVREMEAEQNPADVTEKQAEADFFFNQK